MRRPMRNRRRNLELLAREVPRGLKSNDDVLQVAQLLWESIDTPLSLGLSILCNNGQLEDALRVEFNPSRYLQGDWKTARDDYQSIAFLRKMPLDVRGINRGSAAWEKFRAAEEQCRKTNLRFRASRVRGFPPRVEAVLHTACRKISHWLGDLSAKSWALRCRFGPGVDAFNKGTRTSPYHKLSRLSVTPDFEDGALGLIRCHPVWERILSGFEPEEILSVLDKEAIRKRVTILPGNRVTFVPKTALIDRSIAIEPGMNIFAQLGLGALLRSRLKRAGLDLDKQEPNQELAKLGSRTGAVATIDLSSASDTVALEVVRELLPEPWFVAMDWCRSKKGTYMEQGELGCIEHTFNYEKFSSMGNGFTFELESLIFYSLALAVADVLELTTSERRLIRSYGDDITMPTAGVTLLEEVLDFCGFTVNLQKSYSSGVFRESCGADFFNGVNIRPYFLKEYCNDARSLFRLANGIRRVAYRRNFGLSCDRKLRPVWVHIIHRIPNSLRDLKIPFRPKLGISWEDIESGDGGLAVSHDEALSSPYVRFNTDYMAGWNFAQLQARPSSQKADTERFGEFYLYALYASRNGSTSETTTYDQVVGRGESGSRLNLGAYAPSWLDIGGWESIPA